MDAREIIGRVTDQMGIDRDVVVCDVAKQSIEGPQLGIALGVILQLERHAIHLRHRKQ